MPIKKNEIKVLRALCKDARRTLEDIGNETGLTGPGVGKIIDRLEHSGVITSYIALPALEKIGYNLISMLLFRYDHAQEGDASGAKSKSSPALDELNSYLKKTKGIIFATPVQGSNYTHMLVSAHADFSSMEEFLKEFRTRWDGRIRDDMLVLMSPNKPIRNVNYEVF
jgi:DNA-binding Lrp family transcriptional regulator